MSEQAGTIFNCLCSERANQKMGDIHSITKWFQVLPSDSEGPYGIQKAPISSESTYGIQRALMGSRGPLWDSEGTYWFRRHLWDPEGPYWLQRAPTGFRGPLWDSEGTSGIQRGTQKGSRGPILYPEGVSDIQRTWIPENAYNKWIGRAPEKVRSFCRAQWIAKGLKGPDGNQRVITGSRGPLGIQRAHTGSRKSPTSLLKLFLNLAIFNLKATALLFSFRERYTKGLLRDPKASMGSRGYLQGPIGSWGYLTVSRVSLWDPKGCYGIHRAPIVQKALIHQCVPIGTKGLQRDQKVPKGI